MIRRLIVTAAFLFGATALAQPSSTGTANIRGSVSPAISLFFGSSDFTGVNTAGAVETAPAPDTALTYIADFGDVSSPGGGGFQTVSLTLHLRSNIDYQVNAVLQDDVPAPGSVIPATDIGFAIKSVTWDPASPRIAPRGALTSASPLPGAPAGGNDVVNSTFYVPGVNGVDTLGVPSYAASLGQIPTVAPGIALLEGPRVSNGGSFSTTDNLIAIETEFELLPQLLAASGTFSYTVTFTAIQL